MFLWCSTSRPQTHSDNWLQFLASTTDQNHFHAKTPQKVVNQFVMHAWNHFVCCHRQFVTIYLIFTFFAERKCHTPKPFMIVVSCCCQCMESSSNCGKMVTAFLSLRWTWCFVETNIHEHALTNIPCQQISQKLRPVVKGQKGDLCLCVCAQCRHEKLKTWTKFSTS